MDLDCLGSPAEKAGLCIDDEVLTMNGENLEQMTFDQVRKLLKERNLRGSIKMLVRTYEGNQCQWLVSSLLLTFLISDPVDENSQTVTTGPPTEHSRTPSPQKTVPPSSSSSSTTTTVLRTSHEPSPVYTCLPCPPAPPAKVSLSPSTDAIVHQPTPATPTTTSSLNIFTPKPFRPATSINLDPSNTTETVRISHFISHSLLVRP